MLATEDPNAPGLHGIPAPKDDLYEDRPVAKKIIRIVTVMAYLISVSFAAIVLSAYYIFLWQPPVGGSLSLRDPQAEYLMESPPIQPKDNRSLKDILNKINLYRESIGHPRLFNRTRSSPTFLHNASTNVGGLAEMLGMIRRDGIRQNSDTSTGVYDSIGGKFTESFNVTKRNLNGVNETSTAPLTHQGEDYFEGNFTILTVKHQNLMTTEGGVVGDVDDVVNDTSRQDQNDDFKGIMTSTRDDLNVSEASTSPKGEIINSF